MNEMMALQGVLLNGDAGASVTIWAPFASEVHLRFFDKEIGDVRLEKSQYGYWQQYIPKTKEADNYWVVVDGKALPDPASKWQPQGVHGPSAVVDLARFSWEDDHWQNPLLSKYILYELHVGTFCEEGNFSGVEAKLDHLVTLGVTAIELMPVAQFPGQKNWGYDGVFPFAVQNSYGGPYGLQALVNHCHKKGLAVILDVVYNHVGPEGNCLENFGPYFTDKYKTPWGKAVNFDDAWCDAVRDFFIANALMWFRDFHIDALRLDAVHAMKDFSAVHILQEIRMHTDAFIKESGKQKHLIIECDLNDNRYTTPISAGGYGMGAQWSDEFHHALKVTAGGERTGYYEDFIGIEQLGKCYTHAYVYDGQFSEHRKKKFGVPAIHDGSHFIVFSQNHDQVGNRMMGDRPSGLFSFEMQKLMAGAVFVSPFLPMIFMGEEWAETAPFLFFADHSDPPLIEAVKAGRREEFKAFHTEAVAPDPFDDNTFTGSKIQWRGSNEPARGAMLQYYKDLISLRKRIPALHSNDRKSIEVIVDKEKNSLELRRISDKGQWVIVMNFSTEIVHYEPKIFSPGMKKIFDSAAQKYADLSRRHVDAVDGEIAPESIAIFEHLA